MKVAAFNIQKFGKSKVSDPEVLSTLVKVTLSLSLSLTHTHTHTQRQQSPAEWFVLLQIVSQYSIIVILEVVDSTGKSAKKLLDELNKSVSAEFPRLSLAMVFFT